MPVNGGRCRDCDATIEYVVTEARGRMMPLDVGEDAAGNVVLVDTPAGPRARVFGRGVRPDVPGPRRMPHVATCPGDVAGRRGQSRRQRQAYRPTNRNANWQYRR
jgi:hypothetical protein